jgi:hypothetical protein
MAGNPRGNAHAQSVIPGRDFRRDRDSPASGAAALTGRRLTHVAASASQYCFGQFSFVLQAPKPSS